MGSIDWEEIDKVLRRHESYILTDEERTRIQEEEQSAYESNLPGIVELIKAFEEKLQERGFDTTLTASDKGLEFTYSKKGYYGPAGFQTAFHVDGPLVTACLNPAGLPGSFIQKNDLDENFEIGTGFVLAEFEGFLKNNLLDLLNPINLITTEEKRDRLRALQGH